MLLLCVWFVSAFHVLSCEIHIERSAQENGIPPNLLQAVGLVESGRVVGHQKVAWPWTVQARGEGRMLPNKEAAIEAVQQLQREGVDNIDVGCMQINLKHHPHAFQNLSEAFDPQKNVNYAAGFLKKLHRKWRSWLHAVAHYHSAGRVGLAYQKRVFQTWLKPHMTILPVMENQHAAQQTSAPYVRVTKRYISLATGRSF